MVATVLGLLPVGTGALRRAAWGHLLTEGRSSCQDHRRGRRLRLHFSAGGVIIVVTMTIMTTAENVD